MTKEVIRETELESMLEEWNMLAERYDLLKQYLLRPLVESKNIPLTNGKTHAQAIDECQVLPQNLFTLMQDEYHKAEQDILNLEEKMQATGRFSWGSSGGVSLVKEDFWK